MAAGLAVPRAARPSDFGQLSPLTLFPLPARTTGT